MTKPIEVYIEYYGEFSHITGSKKENIKVSPLKKEGILEIKKYLKERYFIKEDSFMMMINNKYVISFIKDEEELFIADGDILKIIPVISGG